MKTRRGIYYNLKYSEYKIQINETFYFFSSKNHLDKFIELLEENRKNLNTSLTNRFNVNTKINILYDIVLYSKIETRGFFIIHKDVEIKCLREITILNGEMKIEKNCNTL